MGLLRLPWYQVADELIEAAPELAIRLSTTEDTALACCVRLIRGILRRCPADEPPSQHCVIFGTGPVPARICAELGGYTGQPESFVAALATMPQPILEVFDGGLRLRGADRYDAFWGKSHPEEWEAFKRKRPNPKGNPPGKKASKRPARNRPGTGPEPARDRAETGPQDKDRDPPPPRTVNGGTVLQLRPREEEAKEASSPISSPPPPPGAGVDLEGEHPDLEPVEFLTVQQVLVLWQAARLARGLEEEEITPAAKLRVYELREEYSDEQWAHGFNAYLDPKRSRGLKAAEDGWPLIALLTDGVRRKKMPPRPARGFLCMDCRGPANELKTPEGRAICYPCYGERSRAAK